MRTVPLKSTIREIIRKHGEQIKCGAEHYKDLYYRENVITDSDINAIPRLPLMEEVDKTPTEEELSTTIDPLPRDMD